MRRRGGTGAGIAIALALVLGSAAGAAPAELDPAFGDGGVAVVPLHGEGGVTLGVGGVAATADGGAVVLGGAMTMTPFDPLAPDFTGFPDTDVVLVRLGPTGEIDTSFGDDGRALVDLGGFAFAGSVALDAAGRAVFTATRIDSSGDIAAFVGRLTAGGELDASFGDAGLVELAPGEHSFAGGVVVDASGRATVSLTTAADDALDAPRGHVIRLLANGAPDTSFGSGGTATLPGSPVGAFGVAVAPDGGFAVAGVEDRTAIVARLDGSGQRVASFGVNGVARLPVLSSVAFSVGVLGDGRVVAGGTRAGFTGVLARLDDRGRPDQSFGIGGVRTLRAPDGSIFPVVSIAPTAGGTLSVASFADFFAPQAIVGRVLGSGLEDTGFGGDGFVAPLEGRGVDPSLTTVLAPHTDGRLLVAGVASSDAEPTGFAARLREAVPGQPPGEAAVQRAAGFDRIDTSIEVSRSIFAARDAGSGRQALRAILATSEQFPDALVAAPLAAAERATLLLNPPDRLDPRVRAELGRVVPPGSRILLMGGERALGRAVEDDLRAAGYGVERVAGEDRYETSVRAAERLPVDTVLLARGDDFADALAAGPAAAEVQGAVLLTAGSMIPQPVAAYLSAHPDLPRYAVGGQAAAAAPGAEPLVGQDRWETAALVAERFFHTPARSFVASGQRFPDGVSAGAAAALTGGPLLLSPHHGLPDPTAAALARSRAYHRVITAAGGTAVLSDTVLDDIRRAIAP